MENKKMNPQLAQTIFKFIAPQGACMHWAGSSKNKINLQLNKNTIFNIPVMKKRPTISLFFGPFSTQTNAYWIHCIDNTRLYINLQNGTGSSGTSSCPNTLRHVGPVQTNPDGSLLLFTNTDSSLAN